jgi:hypothetical protein
LRLCVLAVKKLHLKIKKMKNTNLSLTALLTILFTGLKLTGYLRWNWLWVLAPLWIPGAVFALVFGILLTLKILHK